MADQRHYDTIYQERYMGLPQDNASGYHDGSAINFARALRASSWSYTARETTTFIFRARSC